VSGAPAKKTCATKCSGGLKVNDDQAELDEKVTNRHDKQLKGVTSMVG